MKGLVPTTVAKSTKNHPVSVSMYARKTSFWSSFSALSLASMMVFSVIFADVTAQDGLSGNGFGTESWSTNDVDGFSSEAEDSDRSEEEVVIVLKDNKNEPFSATASEFQFVGFPFTISLSNATDDLDNALQGNYRITVTSMPGTGFENEGVVFDDQVFFTNGNASVTDVVLLSQGTHRLEVALEDENLAAVISPDILAFDFSGFTVSAITEDVYDGKIFDIEILDAVDAKNVLLGDNREITITSNQIGGDGFVVDSEEFDFTAGGLTIPVVLTNDGQTGDITHIITIAIEGISQTKQISVDVKENKAGFEMVTYLKPNGDPLDVANTITAGVQFLIEISDVSDLAGNPFTDPLNAEISSDLQPDILQIENVTYDVGDEAYYLTINPTGGKTITKKGDHDITVTLPDFGVSLTVTEGTSPIGKLTVVEGNAVKLVITEQNAGGPDNAGNFDNQATPIGNIIVATADDFGNLSDHTGGATDRITASISTGPSSNLTGTLNPIFGSSSEINFDNLQVDKDGEYILLFTADDYDNVLSEPFTMINVEDQTDFTIEYPGPQLAEPFDLTLTGATNEEGDSLNTTESLTIDIADLSPYTESVDFVDGRATIVISEITPFDFETFEGLIAFDGQEILISITFNTAEDDVTVPFYLSDNLSTPFTAALSPDENPIIGNPFNITISGAQDVSGTNLGVPEERDHYVEVVSSLEGTVFSGDISFDNGNAVIENLVLFDNTDLQTLTITIDWVKDPVPIEDIQVQEGILVKNETSSVLSEQNPHLFPSLTAGYSQAEANAISETITIESASTVDITNITVASEAATSDYVITPPDPDNITDPATSTTFAIRPAINLDPATYSETITVSYRFDGMDAGEPDLEQSFGVEFTVSDSYQIALTDEDENPLGAGNELNFGSAIAYDNISETITITNTGTGDIDNISVALSGQNPSSFSLGTLTTTGPIGTDATATFTVGPVNELATGSYSAIVTVAADEDISEEFIVLFNVTEQQVDIDVVPADLLFIGVFSEGYNPDNAERQIQVTNTGFESLESGTTISITGSAFDLSTTSPIQETEQVAPGESFTFTVKPVMGLGEGSQRVYEETLTIEAIGSDPGSSFPVNVTIIFIVDDMEWLGTNSAFWTEGSNWKPANENWPAAVTPSRPTEYVNIVIPAAPNNPVIFNNPAVNVRTEKSITIQEDARLTVQNQRTLTVASGGELNIESSASGTGGEMVVAGLVLNSGTITLESVEANGGQLTVGPEGRVTSTVGSIVNPVGNVENFVIQSNSTNSGSVLLNSPGVYARVQRWMKPNAHIHLLSVPVSGLEIGDFIANNGGLSVINIRKFNEATHAWLDWNAYEANEEFALGKSYFMARNGAGTVNFDGELIQGLHDNVPVERAKFGWNALGNPYPSSFLVNSFINENMSNFQPDFTAVYVYDYTKPLGARYEPLNLVNNATLTNSQGFFARLGDYETVPADVVFTNEMRVHANAFYYKNGETEEESHWKKLRLNLSRPNNSSTTLLAFDEFMTPGLDQGYDAGLFGFDPAFYIYTQILSDSVKLAIQALPDSGFNEMYIPVGFVLSGSAPYTLSADLSELPENLSPLLYDALNNTYTELTTEGIALDLAADSYHNRFFIRMQDDTNEYEVSYAVQGDGGSLAAEHQEVLIENDTYLPEGAIVTFTATPWLDYKVSNWYVNGELQEDQTDNTLIIDRLLENILVDVEFELIDKSGEDVVSAQPGQQNSWKAYYSDGEIIIEGMWPEETDVRLVDLSGKGILEKSLTPGPVNKIFVKGIQEGIYLLRIEDNGHIKTKRLYIR